MPLPTPKDREHVHRRKVICDGFQRTDGLWDIEGHLVDTKTHEIPMPDRDGGIIPVGEALHDMAIRITVDLDLEIHEVVTTMDATPFRYCPSIASTYDQLVGEKIRPGFTRKVRDLFGSTKGCTHLVELLGPVATTAIQVTFQARMLANDDPRNAPAQHLLNSCHAYAQDSSVVKTYFNDYYQPMSKSIDTTE